MMKQYTPKHSVQRLNHNCTKCWVPVYEASITEKYAHGMFLMVVRTGLAPVDVTHIHQYH